MVNWCQLTTQCHRLCEISEQEVGPEMSKSGFLCLFFFSFVSVRLITDVSSQGDTHNNTRNHNNTRDHNNGDNDIKTVFIIRVLTDTVVD